MSLWNGHTQTLNSLWFGSELAISLKTVVTKRSLRHAITWLLAIVLCSLTSIAQSTSGSFIGRVTDSNGLVVSGAKIELTNEATSVTSTTSTNKAESTP